MRLGYCFLKWTLNSPRKKKITFPGIHCTWFSGTGVLGAQRREKCDCLRASVASSGSTTLTASTSPFSVGVFSMRASKTSSLSFRTYNKTGRAREMWLILVSHAYTNQSINPLSLTVSKLRSELHRNKNNKPIYQQEKKKSQHNLFCKSFM